VGRKLYEKQINMEKEYFITDLRYQKSQNFLWPLIGFKQNEKFKIKSSYLYWTEADYSIDNYELIVHYDVDVNSEDFKRYEKDNILTKSVVACFKVDPGMIYIFDMTYWHKDITEFMLGAYSKMRDTSKKTIMRYFGDENNNNVIPGRPIHRALYPNLYYELVAEELGVPVTSLRELTNPYDLEDETCTIPIIDETDCCDKKEPIRYEK
jgi:hypothetical protein